MIVGLGFSFVTVMLFLILLLCCPPILFLLNGTRNLDVKQFHLIQSDWFQGNICVAPAYVHMQKSSIQ